MAKSVLVIDTPESCSDCQLVKGKMCPALENVDLSPCKALGRRHSKCPLIALDDLLLEVFGMSLGAPLGDDNG